MFHDFLDTHAAAAVALLHLVADRLRDSDLKRTEFAACDTPSRVAQRILELAERFGEPEPNGTRITVADQARAGGCAGGEAERFAVGPAGMGGRDEHQPPPSPRHRH